MYPAIQSVLSIPGPAGILPFPSLDPSSTIKIYHQRLTAYSIRRYKDLYPSTNMTKLIVSTMKPLRLWARLLKEHNIDPQQDD